MLITCNDGGQLEKQVLLAPVHIAPVNGSRIAWDLRTLTKIADGGYARIIELCDQRLASVYSRGSNLYIKWSNDKGETWHSEKELFTGDDNYTMTNAEAIQLDDNSIIVGCNRRVRRDSWGGDYKYGILIRKSTDLGQTWKEPQLIYHAGNHSDIGCWEPVFLQLPSGELQCYFANEFPYSQTNEQEISLLRSHDRGNSWTNNIETACFAANSRDGMPVPIFQESENRILLAIEENYGDHVLQPVIIKMPLDDNWKNGYVSGNDPRRIHAVPGFDPSRYAGAPYLAQLKTGELIICYQDREGRTNHFEVMMVRIAGDLDDHFNRESKPFDISPEENGLWNSLCVLDQGAVLAVTSTSAFDGGVYMIRGRVLSELKIARINSENLPEEILYDREKSQIFIGHLPGKILESNLNYSDSNLIVSGMISDFSEAWFEAEGSNSGMRFFIDPDNLSLDAPGAGIYRFQLDMDRKLEVYEGYGSRWVRKEEDRLIQTEVISSTGELHFRIKIPWSVMGGKPESECRINFSIYDEYAQFCEPVCSTIENASYSWIRSELK